MADEKNAEGHGAAARPNASNEETLDRKATGIEELPTALQPPSTRRPSLGSRGLELESGSTFGPYRLLRLLGKGGFGQVWEAESVTTRRRLAVKVLTAAPTATPEEIERFRREGRLAASLSHPHCVYVFSAEEIQGFPVITMELMAGGTLQDRLRDQGPVPVPAGRGLRPADCRRPRGGSPGRCHPPRRQALQLFPGRVGCCPCGRLRALQDSRRGCPPHCHGIVPWNALLLFPRAGQGSRRRLPHGLYSLGATLYALLTGKPPFSGGSGTQVLARILTEPPEPFSDGDAPVPRGLQLIVLRLLAKDKSRRYASYAALRDALLPYSTNGLAAGDVGRRLVAIVTDMLLFNLALGLVLGPQMLVRVTLLNYVLHGSLLVAYFAVLEGLWGQSLGKRLVGLRVVRSTGGAVPMGASWIRSTVFVSVLSLPSVLLVAYLSPAGFLVMANQSVALFLASTVLMPVALLCSTMRLRNGYAALHDLVTQTRVMTLKAVVTRPSLLVGPSGVVVDADAPRTFGPYRELHPLWETSSEGVLVARDGELQRDVWIHRRRQDADTLSLEPGNGAAERLAASRSGRLQWLQGSRDGVDTWDAYEAPAGVSLRNRIRSRGPMPWVELRHVVLDVAAELACRESEDCATAPLHLSRVWLSADGGAKLLDFSPTGEEEAVAAPDWRGLLHELLLSGLEGAKTRPTDLACRVPRVPLPEHARPLIQRICGIGEPLADPAAVRDELLKISGKPASLSRMKRVVPLALTAVVPAVLLVTTSLFVLGIGDSLSAARALKQSRSALRKLTNIADEQDQRLARGSIRIMQAHGYSTLRSLASDESRGFGRSIAIGMLSGITANDRKELEAALDEHATASAEEVEAARRRLDAMAPPPRFGPMVPAIVLLGLFPLAVLAMLLAPIVRGAPLLALLGVAVQNAEGGQVSRLRCFLRAVVGWGPFALYHLWQPWPVLYVLFPITVVAGVAVALARPDGGLPDRIVGTRLVPR